MLLFGRPKKITAETENTTLTKNPALRFGDGRTPTTAVGAALEEVAAAEGAAAGGGRPAAASTSSMPIARRARRCD